MTLSGGDGDEQFVISFGDNGTLHGGSGDDTLFLRDSSGHDGDWIFQIQDNGHASLTSANDPNISGLVSLDHGEINSGSSDASHLVFGGDASGHITFSDGTEIEFSDLDDIVV